MFLTSITTKSGQVVEFGQLSVLVGPNNSGKSRTLRDLLDYFSNTAQGQPSRLTVLQSVGVKLPETYDELMKDLTFKQYESNGTISYEIRGGGPGVDQDSPEWLLNNWRNNGPADSGFQQFAMRRLFVRVRYLNAETRLTSASSNQEGLLKELYNDSTKTVESELRQAFRDAFGLDILLDYSDRTTLSLRVASDLNGVSEDPREAQPVLSVLEKIEQQGDGFRSFVGVVLSVLLSKTRLVLIDEPEAFLHQAQARVLGNLIARLAQKIEGQVLISTHSSSFLSGLLSADRGVNIFRLNRTGTTTTFTVMPENVTPRLTTEPLLASQRVIDAIFQEGVVVCESDRDRLLYQAVANRQLDDYGMFFLQADNKQTLHHIVNLMKSLTIPVTAIADIDILDDGPTLKKLLSAFRPSARLEEALAEREAFAGALQGENDAEIFARLQDSMSNFQQQMLEGKHTLEGARSALKRLLADASTSAWRKVKRNGVAGLSEPAKTHATRAIEACQACGLLVVPVGELEQWIKLGAHKQQWPIQALEAIYAGKCPTPLENFVKLALTTAHQQ